MAGTTAVARIATFAFGLHASFASVVCGQDVRVTLGPQLALKQDEPAGPRLIVEPYVDFGKLGVWGFVAAEKQYVSAVAGPYVTIFRKGDTSLGAGVGAGLEYFPQKGSYRNYGRYAGYAWIDGLRGVVSVYYENGASRTGWLQIDMTWQSRPWIGIGGFYQTDDGGGPRVIVTVPGSPLKIWGGPMWTISTSRPTYLLGADVTLARKK